MKKMTLLALAALVMAVGFATPATAREPVLREDTTKTVFEGNRHRRSHRRGGRGGRGGGHVWFGFGHGGHYRPAHRGYYYAPPPPPPPPVYYYAPTPAPGYYGGVVVVR